jgi:hypothetical protein
MPETNKSAECAQCRMPMPAQARGRPRKYCSAACRQQAYEARHGLPNWGQKQAIREAERKLSKLTRRVERDRMRRIDALELEFEHNRHTHPFDCVDTIRRHAVAIAEVLEFVSYLVLESDVGEYAEGLHLGRAIQRLVEDVRLMGFRATPENESLDSAQHRWAEQGRQPGRSRIIEDLRRGRSEDEHHDRLPDHSPDVG